MCAHAANRSYRVYILTNKRNGTLYVGVTNSLERRIWEHKTKLIEGFTKQYGPDRLVHFEEFRDVNQAIAREKEIKGWLRKRKLALIEKDNPDWADLSAGWLGDARTLRGAASEFPVCHSERREESSHTTAGGHHAGFFAALRMTDGGMNPH